MLTDALRYPLATRAGRDALAACTGLALAVLVCARVAEGLWPTLLTPLPALVSLVPAALFTGYLGSVLAAPEAPPAFSLSTGTLRAGARLLAVVALYLLVPALVLLGVVYLLLASGGGPSSSPLFAIGPTVALFALLVAAYLLPAGLGTGLERGVRASLSRSAVAGLGNAAYFFGWTTAAAMLATAWGALGAVRASTLLSVLATAWFVYAHVVAARLAGEGLERSRWQP